MPWVCLRCRGAEILDDDACTTCGARKSAWTVSDARTRRFRVHAHARFEVLAGRSDQPGPPSSPEQTDRDAAPATVAWSLARADAAELSRLGLRPAPAYQLIVRAHAARPGVDPRVHVAVDFTRREPVELAVATPPAAAAGDVDVRLLLVHGPGPSALAFPGLEVIDVSDHGEPWVARSIRISALGSTSPCELPVRPLLAPPRRDRIELFAGRGDEATSADHPRQVERAGAPAATAWTIPRSVVAQTLARGGRPAPAHQLTVRVFGPPGADLALRLAVEGGPERSIPSPAVVEGGPSGDDVRLLFVHGDGALPAAPGLHVIDVAAPGVPGHAPAVTISALGLPPVRVPLQATSAAHGDLRCRVLHRAELRRHGLRHEEPFLSVSWVPHVKVSVLAAPPGVALPPKVSDLSGVADFGDVPAGSYEVELVADGARDTGVVEVPGGAEPTEVDLGEVKPTGLERNLKVGRDVMPIVRDALRSNNQVSWAAARTLFGEHEATAEMKGKGDVCYASLAEHEPQDRPPAEVTAPAPQYGEIHLRARLAQEYRLGNCGEKAAYAAILCAEAGLHPVEVMEAQAPADHAFCVVGRVARSRCNDARDWGPDAVIVDPWHDEVYPASELGQHMKVIAKQFPGAEVVPTRLFRRVRL